MGLTVAKRDTNRSKVTGVERFRLSPLWLACTVPFVLQILVFVGFVGYISFKNAQAAISDLAGQLMMEVGLRVDQELAGRLHDMERITQTNAALVRSGKLDPADNTAMLERFSLQLNLLHHTGSAALASEQGHFAALERDDQSLIWRQFDKDTRRFVSRRLNDRGEVIGELENYDPKNDPPHDPWYARARTQKGPYWSLASSVAKGNDNPELMVINFTPIYDDRDHLLGVAGSSMYITEFGRFLCTLLDGSRGQVFVIDKQGRLIASSSGEKPFRSFGKTADYTEVQVRTTDRLAASESGNPLTVAAVNAIHDRFGRVDGIVTSEHLRFDWSGREYFLMTVPISRANLNWVTVIVVPRQAFTAQIDRNTLLSIAAAILALITALTLGTLTARWIVKPILSLNRAARDMARGDWKGTTAVIRSDEIGELAGSFNDMAVQLKELFESLDQRVRDRTADLAHSNEQLRAAKEAAEAASLAKSTFLANMSHELRSPLNAILGYTNLLLRDAATRHEHLSDAQEEGLTIVRRSGEHLLTLINNVLELSRIEAGRTNLNMGDFDLLEVLRGVEAMFSVKAREKGLSLRMDIDPSLPRSIRSDEVKLRQVLINVVSNAVKFTETGGVTIRALVHPVEDGPDACRVRIEVADTGPGISPEDQARLFEAFSQATAGRRYSEGTGLGLAITRQFVELLGGSISVRSTVGGGSIFTVEITAQRVKGVRPAVEREMRRVIGLAPGQSIPRVLVVDDDTDNMHLLTHLLSRVGFEVREASDGQAAVDLWETWRPHLIWMDMRMPGMDGREATRTIRAREQGRKTKILALSASSFSEEREQFLADGCDDFVRKPFQEDDLLEMMEHHLGIRWQYSDEVESLDASLTSTVAMKAALVRIPGDLLEKLRQASILGMMQDVEELIEQVRAHDDELGREMARMAGDFDYGRLADLIRDLGEK